MKHFWQLCGWPIRVALNNNTVKGETTDMLIERALQLELDEQEEAFSMSTLRQALPQDEEGHFRQAIQCTICLNAGHSAVECNIRIYCPICHSKAHTVEQCEYNMLNQHTAVVRKVELHRLPRRNNRDASRNGPNIRSRVGTRTGNIELTGITMIPRKRKNIEVTAATVKTTAGMTITDQQTGVATSKDLEGNIGSTKSNDATMKAQTTIGTQSRAKINHSHRDIIDSQNKIRNNQRSSGNDTHHQLHQRRNLAYGASCANNFGTTQHNAHSGRAKVRPST